MTSLPTVLSVPVKQEWIDHNGHMGSFAYATVFNQALEALLESIGIDEDYLNNTDRTIYTIETHTSYLKELRIGDTVKVSAQLLSYDSKRMHLLLVLNNDKNETCSYYEVRLLHVRLYAGERPIADALPEVSLQALKAMLKEHSKLPRPEKAHPSISIGGTSPT
ncbi:thioesterase family protein (plasmid) [Mesorhizobium sp. ORM8.1]